MFTVFPIKRECGIRRNHKFIGGVYLHGALSDVACEDRVEINEVFMKDFENLSDGIYNISVYLDLGDRRMQESNDNIFYCAECTYDKSNGTMFLYMTDITEVRGSIKPKDSMKVEGGFLVRRKYFRSEYEAQEYIDSLPNPMSMSRNESFRMSEFTRRSRSIKEWIDNSDTIEFLENSFEKLRYHSKNLNKTQYYLFSLAYDSFQEYRNGDGTERDIYKKCREFAEYCQTHNKNLTKMQDSLVDDILSNTQTQ